MRPQVLDIGQVVGELDKLLRRALGEHISFTTQFAPDLWPIEIDLGQFEQVLVNLAVNARDAMPAGGRLILETANVELDETYREIDHQVVPGRYVRLTVSDTGAGMEPEVAKRAFEPFFSTKPRGQGTGLGLTTVYGIVTEAGGGLQIYSEPDVGTTVKVHLPASSRSPAPPQRAGSAGPNGRGETVLVVEDEDGVRRLTERILTNAGYTVLTASGGGAALEICAREQRIDLLLSDVVMPEMLGPEVVRRVTALRPGIKVLYMSGYIHQAIGGADPALTEDIALVEKPFSAEALLTGVRAALD